MLLLMIVSLATAQNTKKPNILFIAVDDLRPELNCYGQTQIISPNVDKLAASGLTFNRSYCNVPVCGASRASLLSGVRPNQNRFVSAHISLDEELPGVVSLPCILKTMAIISNIFKHFRIKALAIKNIRNDYSNNYKDDFIKK